MRVNTAINPQTLPARLKAYHPLSAVRLISLASAQSCLYVRVDSRRRKVSELEYEIREAEQIVRSFGKLMVMKG